MKAITTLLLSLLVSLAANAQHVRLALLHGDADVFSYEISVLRLALKHAPGEHTLELIDKGIETNQERILVALESANADFDVFFTGMSAKREQRFLQVDFPITRGLLGHRVFVTHCESLDALRAIKTLQQAISHLSVGSGFGWPDTDIFKAAGFEVVVSDYDSLWKMVNAKRFIGFNRGIQEAFIEIGTDKNLNNQLVVDHNIMISYPFDYLFYVSRNNPELHQLISQGLKTAHDNGAFQENFDNHPSIQMALKNLNFDTRRIFNLSNPLLTERIKKLNSSYWYSFDL